MTPKQKKLLDALIETYELPFDKIINESDTPQIPQQVFMNSSVMPGVHYSEKECFLINNYFYTINTNIPRVLNNEHSLIVQAINKQDDVLNVDSVKSHLLRKYTIDAIRYLSNWCNLSFSEN